MVVQQTVNDDGDKRKMRKPLETSIDLEDAQLVA